MTITRCIRLQMKTAALAPVVVHSVALIAATRRRAAKVSAYFSTSHFNRAKWEFFSTIYIPAYYCRVSYAVFSLFLT
jgi:hypothetical protein